MPMRNNRQLIFIKVGLGALRRRGAIQNKVCHCDQFHHVPMTNTHQAHDFSFLSQIFSQSALKDGKIERITISRQGGMYT